MKSTLLTAILFMSSSVYAMSISFICEEGSRSAIIINIVTDNDPDAHYAYKGTLKAYSSDASKVSKRTLELAGSLETIEKGQYFHMHEVENFNHQAMLEFSSIIGQKTEALMLDTSKDRKDEIKCKIKSYSK